MRCVAGVFVGFACGAWKLCGRVMLVTGWMIVLCASF